MNAQEALDKLKEDRPIVEAFVNLCLQRVREKHPLATMRDIEIQIIVNVPGSTGSSEMAIKAIKLLDDMVKEGVAF